MALVEVKPIDRTKWHGQKGAQSFATPKSAEVLYDAKTGKYATGLTEEEAAKYGKLLGADLSDTFDYDKPHPYFSSKPAQIRLENSTMIFDTSKPSHYVKVKNMKASKLVANSLRELESGLWPDATHVIYDEQEDIDVRATRVENRRRAMEIFGKMSPDSKMSVIQILSDKSMRGMSNNALDVEIDDLIATRVDEFLKTVEMGPEEVRLRALVLELLYKNILTKEGNSVYYMGDQISVDYEGAVSYFKDPNNVKLKVSIMEKLETKKA
jgi:hypothetical protein